VSSGRPTLHFSAPVSLDGGGATAWYAVHTQARREDLAEAQLRSLGVRTFCPRHRQRVILHGYRREVIRPLFPGYLFAAFDVRRELRAVHYACGVRGVVLVGREPAEVPAELLEGIRARMQDGVVVLHPKPFRPGQRLEIVAGPFRGYRGIFEAHLRGDERVAILLEALQYNARIIVDRAAVEAVG
jgi:transcriptional antiterminator RfaH